MEIFLRIIFPAFCSELFFALLAIAVRHDRKRMLIILSLGTVLSGVVGFGAKILDSRANDLPGPVSAAPASPYAQATAPKITTALSRQQAATNKAPLANDLSPEIFITSYFDAINNQDYQISYSMLSSTYQANQTYSEYVNFWGTVSKVDILSITIRSQSTSAALIYVETHYHYKEGYVTTGHTTYRLIKDGQSWLIDPN